MGYVFTFHVAGRGKNPRVASTVTFNRVSRWFKDAAKAAGLGLARLHDLRHTAITYMLSRGVKPRRVQEIAGHASITTTEGYSKALIGDLYDEMMEGLK